MRAAGGAAERPAAPKGRLLGARPREPRRGVTERDRRRLSSPVFEALRRVKRRGG